MNLLRSGERPLSLIERSVSYLEKHRIYELFFELATELIIHKPDDHLLFMKNYLDYAARKRDVPRIVLLAPPDFDKASLAHILQNELGVRPLTLSDIDDTTAIFNNVCQCNEKNDVIIRMKQILETKELRESGWLLVDFPRTKMEARASQRVGIIPTHVIQVIPSSALESGKNSDSQIEYCSYINASYTSHKDQKALDYERNLPGLREAYSNFWIEVEMGTRTIDELGKACAKLAKQKKNYGAPSLMRVALIGSRGSGCCGLAKYLSERFNLVYVNFDYILEQVRLQYTTTGDVLRLFEHRWGGIPSPEIKIQILKTYVSSYECIRRGWVLTGFPKSVEEFKLLDTIASPPNRVIFVEVSAEICRERLLSRRYNIVTGSIHDLSSTNCCDMTNDTNLGVHPKDYRNIVAQDIQEYQDNMPAMMQYAGESAFKVNGSAEERTVRESIEACLMQAAPRAKPREPRAAPEINLEDIEFDPDDESNLIILNDKETAEIDFSCT
ncbi:hypothetical protein KM043_015974 [Ampulex compressa]|nr:hypothetical protein KM043_015974 [Ampulex compressa]